LGCGLKQGLAPLTLCVSPTQASPWRACHSKASISASGYGWESGRLLSGHSLPLSHGERAGVRGDSAGQASQRQPSSPSSTSLSKKARWPAPPRSSPYSFSNARLHPFHGEVDHRRGVEREQLAQEQAADDGDAKRYAQLEPGPWPITKGSAPKSAATVVINDGPEAQEAGFPDRLRPAPCRAALRVDGEVRS